MAPLSATPLRPVRAAAAWGGTAAPSTGPPRGDRRSGASGRPRVRTAPSTRAATRCPALGARTRSRHRPSRIRSGAPASGSRGCARAGLPADGSVRVSGRADVAELAHGRCGRAAGAAWGGRGRGAIAEHFVGGPVSRPGVNRLCRHRDQPRRRGSHRHAAGRPHARDALAAAGAARCHHHALCTPDGRARMGRARRLGRSASARLRACRHSASARSNAHTALRERWVHRANALWAASA
jgi:hypothetical protein